MLGEDLEKLSWAAELEDCWGLVGEECWMGWQGEEGEWRTGC